MAQTDKMRPGAGPPPLLFLKQALPPAEHLKPHHLNPLAAKTPADAAAGEQLSLLCAFAGHNYHQRHLLAC